MREVTVRTFKSGNSLAIRIPKAWGFAPGEEIDVIPLGDGRFELRRMAIDKMSLAELYGSFSDAFMAEGRLPDDEPVRDWSSGNPRDEAA